MTDVLADLTDIAPPPKASAKAIVDTAAAPSAAPSGQQAPPATAAVPVPAPTAAASLAPSASAPTAPATAADPSAAVPTPAPAASSPDARATGFQGVDGGAEQYSGATLMVEAYSAVWLLVLGWVVLLWKKQAALTTRLAGLEAAIDKAAARLDEGAPKSGDAKRAVGADD
jgi:hypothetical protein